MAKINFNLKYPNIDGTSPIRLVLRWSGNTLFYSTKESINPKFWQSDKTSPNYQRSKVVKDFPDAFYLNECLDQLASDAKSAFRELKKHNDVVRKPELRQKLDEVFNRRSKTLIPGSLIPYIDYLAKKRTGAINPNNNRVYSPKTIYKYYNVKSVLEEINPNIDFQDIDMDFYTDYLSHLSKKGHSVNTIGKYVQTLKALLNYAVEDGVNTNLKFKSKNFKVLSEPAQDIYLNKSELSKIERLDLSHNARLDKVRDLFLVGCWTGLRFSDFTTLTRDHISKEGFIEIETYKTQREVVIPLHPSVKRIFDKYSYELPRVMSNQKFNDYVKEVGRLAGINERFTKKITKGSKVVTSTEPKYNFISSHTARRSFATNLYLDDFPSLDIMKITGHKTERAFLSYIKMSKKESAIKLSQHWNNLLKVSNA